MKAAFSLALASALSLASFTNAAVYSPGRQGAMTNSDQLKSPDGKCVFHGITGPSAFYLSYISIPVFTLGPVGTTVEASQSNTGRITYTSSAGVVTPMGTAGATGTYKFMINNDCEFGVYLSTNTAVRTWHAGISAANLPYWAFKTTTGEEFGTYSDRSQTLGSNVIVYVLDSGFSAERDPSGTLNNKIVNVANVGGSDDFLDRNGHGSRMAQLIASSELGFTPGAQIGVVKITKDRSRVFLGTHFIDAVQAVMAHSTSRTKIMSFSGLFDRTFTIKNFNAISCAIQWAFKKNILVITAAGNDNDSLATSYTNPYRLNVGAAYAPSGDYQISDNQVPSVSNYGEPVDIWGPKEVLDINYVSGTSIATAFAAGVAAQLLDGQAAARNNTGPAMRHIKLQANVDFMSSSDPKVTNSSRGTFNGRQYLSTRQLVGTQVSTASWSDESIEFCSAKFSLPVANPSAANWKTLKSQLDAGYDGKLVWSYPGGTSIRP